MLTRLLPWIYSKLGAGRWLRNRTLEGIYLLLLFAYKRLVEDPFANLARRRPDLFRGGHILDVGANVGYTASVFAGAADPEHRVYAFEPEPTNLRRLVRVLDARGLHSRVSVIPSAVGDRVGEVELSINPSHPGDHRVNRGSGDGVTVPVPMVTLDAFAAQGDGRPVRFVKIDVQGFEMAVCRGMAGLIASNARLAVAFEYEASSARAWEYDASDLLSFFEKRGFDVFVLKHNGDLAPASSLEIDRVHRKRGYVDILATREGMR